LSAKPIAPPCSSNCDLSDFEERFQTRFQCIDLSGPTPGELETLLRRFTDNAAVIAEVIRCACGLKPGEQNPTARANVRQALLDLDMALLAA
jgi:hypothetical protein